METSFTKVDFCSHHYHKNSLGGRDLVVPCRDEHELVGRGRIQKGKPATLEEAAPMAKAYAQLWLLNFFHCRDLRLGAFAMSNGS